MIFYTKVNKIIGLESLFLRRSVVFWIVLRVPYISEDISASSSRSKSKQVRNETSVLYGFTGDTVPPRALSN
jgi:hypothetical protein